MKIPFTSLIIDPAKNARKTYRGINELAESIRINGQLQPIVVRKRGDKYELLAGFRRAAACKKLGIDPECHVKEDSGPSDQIVNLVENLSREDLGSYEYAQALVKLRKSGMQNAAISDFLISSRNDDKGTSVQHINNLINMALKLPPPVLKAWKERHPMATTKNLGDIYAKENALELWEELCNPTKKKRKKRPARDTDDGDSEGGGSSRSKRRSPADMERMLSALRENDSVDRQAVGVVASVFRWLNGAQKTLLGVSIEGGES